MGFESKTYVRLGSMFGGVIGVLAMTVTVSTDRCVGLGAVLMAASTGIGFAIGSKIEKRKG